MKAFKLLVLGLVVTTAVYSQDKAMEDNLKKTLAPFDTTKSLAVMMPLSAQLDLIAAKYPEQWQTNYYAAFAKAIISFNEPDLARKDLLIDEADTYLQNIVALKVENDERYVLAALLANARMAVDGDKRWQKYGPIFDENLKKAKEFNAENPHIYYLKGVSLFYTPKMFGGGPKKAKPYLEKAKGFYAKLDKNNILIPSWGEPITDYYIAECDK